MPRILFLALHRPDRSPSQRFRFEQYLGYLKSAGFEYDFSFLLREEDEDAFYSSGNILDKMNLLLRSALNRTKEIFRVTDYDIVFVQRESFMLGTSFFEKQYAKKTRLIFDFDDAIWLQNISEANRRFEWLKNPKKTSDIIAASDLVLAGNNFLADYARKFSSNVEVFPTTIDTNYHKKSEQKKTDKPLCIGWTGSHTTIQHFEHAVPVLKKLKERMGDKIIFKVIGDPEYHCEELSLSGSPWNLQTEIEDLCDIDIGIMPLPDSEWTRGKCGLKGLQYMALEIPVVMSKVGVNVEIVEDGINGFLPVGEDEWLDRLTLLCNENSLRKKLGTDGRKTVLERYSVQALHEQYVNYFKSVLK